MTGSTFLDSLLASFDAMKEEALVTIVDFDTAEERNLVSNIRRCDIDRKKAHIGADRVSQWGHKGKAITQRLTKKNCEGILNGASIVVGCVDNVATRRLLWECATHLGIPYIDTGIAVTGGAVTWEHDMPYRPSVHDGHENKDVKEPPCELIGSRPLAVLTTALASYSVATFLFGNDPNRVVQSFLGSEAVIGDRISWYITTGSDGFTVVPSVRRDME